MINSLDFLYTPAVIRSWLHAEALIELKHDVHIVYFKEPRRNYDPPIYLKDQFSFSYTELDPFDVVSNSLIFKKLILWSDLIWIEKACPYALFPFSLGSLFSNKPIHVDLTDDDEAYANKVYRYPVWPWLVGCYEKNVPRMASTLSFASQYLEMKSTHLSCPKLFLPASTNCEKIIRNEKLRIDTRAFLNLNKKNVVFIYLGGLEPGTNVDLILYAFKKAINKKHDLRLWVVGGGTLLADLKRLSSELDLTSQVTFTGPVASSEISKWTSSADIALATFKKNDFSESKSPVKITEYLSLSLPVIGTNVGEIPSMIGDAGDVIESFNVDSLCESMVSFANDPERIEKLSLTARNRAISEFSHLEIGKRINSFIMKNYFFN